MLQTSSQGRNPFVYPKCPSLAFSGSLSSNWATYFVGYIKIIPSFPAVSLCASTECSLSQLSIDQSVISFPSLSVLNWGGGWVGGWTSCSSPFFLWKLVYECRTLFNHLLLYLYRCCAGFVLAKPSQIINLFAFTFVCLFGVQIRSSSHIIGLGHHWPPFYCFWDTNMTDIMSCENGP